MIIRKAQIKDFEKLKEFKLLSKKEELKYSKTLKPLKETKEKYLEFLKTDLEKLWRAIFIAVENNKIIGIIQAKKYRTLSISKYTWKGYISNLFIKKEQRKKDIATKLIKKAQDWLKENKVDYASVEVHIKNIPAQELFKKNNFKEYTIKLSKII